MTHPEAIERLRRVLDAEGAAYDLLAHEQSVFSAEMGHAQGFGALEEMAPTLILRTNKGHWAAVISGATRISYKKIKAELQMKDVSLATPDAVRELTGAEVGSVCMISRELPTIVDARLHQVEHCYGGCGLPGYTLRIRVADLVRITRARVFDFTEPKS